MAREVGNNSFSMCVAYVFFPPCLPYESIPRKPGDFARIVLLALYMGPGSSLRVVLGSRTYFFSTGPRALQKEGSKKNSLGNFCVYSFRWPCTGGFP